MPDAPAPLSYAAQLASVQAAIETIETKGQRYTINGRELWRADLRSLYAERIRLTPLAAREAAGGSGGIRIRRGVPL